MVFAGKDYFSIEDLRELAAEIGFTSSGPLDMDALEFRPEVREMCAADKCHSYGRSWSCPPAVGTIENAAERCSHYSRGIIVQTTGKMENDFDMRSIGSTSKLHRKNFDTFVRQVRMLFPGCMPMGAGACTICSKCTYPDRPCRHPDRMFPSMEAYGLVINEVCRKSGLEYNYGPQTMTFTSCILID